MKQFYWEGNIEDYFLGHQFEEIFKARIYDPLFIGKKDLTVFDIGACLGVFSLYAAPFSKVIHAFEPTTETFNCISRMVKDNELPVIPHHIAIANKDGEATFYHRPGNKTMNSLTPDAGGVMGNDVETVKTMRLDTFFKEHNIEHVDVMKVDTEGQEYDILCGDGFGNIADKVDVVTGEIHSWSGRNPNQLKDALESKGFTFNWIPGDATLYVAKRT